MLKHLSCFQSLQRGKRTTQIPTTPIAGTLRGIHKKRYPMKHHPGLQNIWDQFQGWAKVQGIALLNLTPSFTEFIYRVKHRSNTIYTILKNLAGLSQNMFCVFFEHLILCSWESPLIHLAPMAEDKYWIIFLKNCCGFAHNERAHTFLNLLHFQACVIKF